MHIHWLFVKPWIQKMMQQPPIGPAKSKHGAALFPCHRKRLDLFLRYKPDWLMCDLYSALSLWYIPACITSKILYHRLFVSEIAFLKNGQKKTFKSLETWRLDSDHFIFFRIWLSFYSYLENPFSHIILVL